MASEAETTTLRLVNEVSGPADAASGALGRLENQIVREQASLGRMESALSRARVELELLSQGAPDQKAVAAFDRQKEAVAALQAKLVDAKDTLEIMAQARVTPKVLNAAQESAASLVLKLQEAQEKLVKLGQATSSPKVDLAAYRKQAEAVAAMGDRAAAQKDKMAGLAEKVKNLGEKADGGKVPIAAIAKSFKMLGGEFGAVESKGVRLIGLLMKMGPVIGIAVAAVIVVGAGLAVFVGLVGKAIGAASELRDEFLKLRTAGVLWWDSSRANASSAEKLRNTIDGVSVSSALARDKIVDYATQLRNARFNGKQLETALKAMSTAGAAGGDELAGKFLEMAKNARFFGGDIDKLAKRMEDKFGAVAKAKLLGIDVQMMKLHENINFIFSGADIEPFLRGLQAVLSFFNRDEDGAKSLRATVTKFTEMAIGGMLRLTIVLLKTYIWIRSHAVAWGAVKLVFYGIIIAIGAVIAVIGLLVAVAAAAAATIYLPFLLVGMAIAVAWAAIEAMYNRWKGMSWSDIGRDIINGIVNGLKAAGGAVWDALKYIVMGAVGNVKNVLGMRSPSRLMHKEVGFQMGAGVAGGLYASASDVSDAATSMASGGVTAAAYAVQGAPSRVQAPQAPPPTVQASNGERVAFTGCTFGGDLTEGTLRGWMMKILDGELTDGAVPA